MTIQTTLPRVNELGYYEMRLESIGGLGANLCGKLLGELGAVQLGLNAASFSSYGSEKRGSPVKAFIRYSAPTQEIRINSPVRHPDCLALFHEAMAGKLPVNAGVQRHCQVVVNTALEGAAIRERMQLAARDIYCVDALALALQSKSRVNMVMLGAIAKVSGFIPLDAVKQAVIATLGTKAPDLLGANLEGVQRGYDEVRAYHFDDDRYPEIPFDSESGGWGWKTAPIGGVNPIPGSSVRNDLSASREGYLPLFEPEKCIHCGLCDSTCPDMVFQFFPGELKGRKTMLNRGLDYRFCKGCLRCVDICPTHALTRGEEKEHPHPDYFTPVRDLLTPDLRQTHTGANSWVTSESPNEEILEKGGTAR